MSAVATRPRGRNDEYVLCPEDGSWFRPLYTDGKCPLCGEDVAGEAVELPFLMRVDGFWLGMGTLALVSVAMCTLVLYYFFSS